MRHSPRGGTFQLPPLPLQYTAHAARQRQWLQGDTLERLADYWTEALAGAPPLLQLPTDRARPARQSYRGASLETTLPADLTDALKVFSRRERVTLFMTLMAAFKVLLFRYTGQTDISVGTPIANRTDARDRAADRLLRQYAGACAAGLTPRSRSVSSCTGVRTTSLDAYTHQDMPFDKLVELLRPQRSLDHSPLFQVVLALQNSPAERLDLAATRIEPVALPASTAKFDVMLSLREAGPELQGDWEYSAISSTATRSSACGGSSKCSCAASSPIRATAASPPCRCSTTPNARGCWPSRPVPPRRIPATPRCTNCSRRRSAARRRPSPQPTTVARLPTPT